MKHQIPATKAAELRYKSKLSTRALNLWFKLGKLSKEPKCEICGRAHGSLGDPDAKGRQKPQYLNGHHIEEKNNYALRFDPINHVYLCPTCHKWGVDSAHRAPVWFMDWLRRERPEQHDYVLRMRRAKPSSRDEWSYQALEEVVDRLEAACKRWKISAARAAGKV